MAVYDSQRIMGLIPPSLYREELEPGEHKRAQEFSHRHLGQQWLLHRWLAKRAIASYTGQRIENICWETTPTGKPIQPTCSVSVSHSANYLAVLLGPGEYNLGIDCESLRVAPLLEQKAIRIIRYFHPADQARLKQALEAGCFVPTFLTLWTRGEALYKLTGSESLVETLGERPLLDSTLSGRGKEEYSLKTIGSDSRLPCLLSYACSPRLDE
ncbi:4'-phosphopantetheinyl transferase family protein [Rothia nasimurium]|uniref:4'-phosphopantetheinyl transferase family protein n=1 Tax=Rothia nasimurium TaxID=85336 RepID=UPI003C6DF2FD